MQAHSAQNPFSKYPAINRYRKLDYNLFARLDKPEMLVTTAKEGRPSRITKVNDYKHRESKENGCETGGPTFCDSCFKEACEPA